jgi:hypothetical protein
MIKVKTGKQNGKWVAVIVDSGARVTFARKPTRQTVERAIKKQLGVSRALREEVYIEESDVDSDEGNNSIAINPGTLLKGISGTRWVAGAGCEAERVGTGNRYKLISGNVFGKNGEMISGTGIRFTR